MNANDLLKFVQTENEIYSKINQILSAELNDTVYIDDVDVSIFRLKVDYRRANDFGVYGFEILAEDFLNWKENLPTSFADGQING